MKKDKGKDEVTDVDRKRHKRFGEEIKKELKKKTEEISFEKFYKEKKEIARKLEKEYGAKTKEKINVTIKMESLAKAKKDKDINVVVQIVPNNYSASYTLGPANQADCAIIKKIFFVQNHVPSKKSRNLEAELKGISKMLVSEKENKREMGIKALREKGLNRWHELEGGIYVPFIDEHELAMSNLNKELQNDIQKHKEVYIGAMERGGSLMTDQLDTEEVSGKVITHKFDVKGNERTSNKQLKQLKEEVEFLLERREGKPTHFIITETFVGGGASKSVLENVIRPILNTYPNATAKLMILQQTGYKDKPEDPQDYFIKEDRAQLKRKKKTTGPIKSGLEYLIEEGRLVIATQRVRMILGEDAGGQALDNIKKSREPFIVFKATEQQIEAYQLSPKDGFATKDVFLALTSGKLKGKIGTIY